MPYMSHVISADAAARALNPPHDNNAVETLHGQLVHDPFRPLEDKSSPATVAWCQRETAAFGEYIKPVSTAFAEALSFLKSTTPTVMRESMPEQQGSYFSCWRKNPGEERPSLFVKDVADYGAPARLLLDPKQIDSTGLTDIAAADFTYDGKTLAYQLSVAGSDARTLRFMDVATGKHLNLEYGNFRSSVSWDHDGQGFHYYQARPEGDKCFDVLYHRMGADPATDAVVFSPNRAETRSYPHPFNRDWSDEPSTLQWIAVSTASEPDNMALYARERGSNALFREIFPLKEGKLYPMHEVGGKIYAWTDLKAPLGRLVRFDPAKPEPENWHTVLPEHPTDPLSGVSLWQGKIFASYTHDTASLISVHDVNGQHLHNVHLPLMSTATFGSSRAADTTRLMAISSYQEDNAIYRYDPATNSLSLARASITPVDLKDCIVERLHATSKDGTQVPMTVIRHPDTALDGTAATRIYSYGGFDVPLTPGFDRDAALQVRKGGIYVVANLRGGGEFGMPWYEGGRLENKTNTYDDLAACADLLVARGYTSYPRLAIQGGSNGGLTTLATMIRHGDKFGAIVSEVPVTDMFRFHIGSYYGFGWKCDYGDPGVANDFNTQATYSPLHNIAPGFRHPPVFLSADCTDDRVDPWHSFKMAATLQSIAAPDSTTVLHVRTGGGHGGGMNESESHADAARVFAFLSRALGPIDQKAYKASLPTAAP